MTAIAKAMVLLAVSRTQGLPKWLFRFPEQHCCHYFTRVITRYFDREGRLRIEFVRMK